MPKHAYIHIPFCAKKCYYCDFNVFVWQGDEWVKNYLHALEAEMKQTMEHFPAQEMSTIYVGGGTPTILNESQMEQFLTTVHRYFPQFHAGGEFTLEANPGTLNIEKLKIMKAGGVNRLSIGIQSFNDQLLTSLGRLHSAEEGIRAVEMAQEAGFDNISIDFMLGLPHQTMEDVRESIKIAKDLGIQHISAYGLQVEENTFFGRWHQEGKLSLPPEELEVSMYLELIDSLAEIGLKQYEISNFARLGYESQHNLAYWYNREYYGIGAGAHGYVNGERHINIGPLKPYMAATEKRLPRQEQYKVTPKERMEEFMFMGLRLIEGITYKRFHDALGNKLDEVYGLEIKQLEEQGLLEVDKVGIRLTQKGMLLGNEVFSCFLRENI